MLYFKFADRNICLEEWFNVALWEPLKWKVDPYAVKNNCDIIADIEIKYMLLNKDIVLGKLLYVEPMGFFEWKVYDSQDGNRIWQVVRKNSQKIYLQYLVSADWKTIHLMKDDTNTCKQTAFEYAGIILTAAFIKYSLLSFHGVLMEHNGSGVIISAASGTGKTTHARLWRDHKNTLIINGDRAVCKHTDKGWIGYGTPWSGTSGEQINRSVPLKALVVLERSEKNSAEVIYGMEAFGAVFPHVLYPSWDKELTEKAMDLLGNFMNHIPIIRLRCRPDVESVDVLNQVLEEL